MKEEYLQYTFAKKRFGNIFLTVDREEVEIVDFGEWNQDAGPDFLQAQIKVGGIRWAGSIEFHLKSSDWYRHQHQDDPNYENVILHLVLTDDKPVYINERKVWTVELESHIDPSHAMNYERFMQNQKALPCGETIASIPHEIIEKQKEAALRERLWQKSIAFVETIDGLDGDRQKAYWIKIARVLGGKVNGGEFEKLVAFIPLRWLSKLSYEPFRLEALLFGVAGFLEEEGTDPYVRKLKDEFQFQKKLFRLQELPIFSWRYSRMRPAGFPDLGIAFLALLWSRFNEVNLFFSTEWATEELTLHAFWNSRYRLAKVSRTERTKKISPGKMDSIRINALIPYLFAIGKWEGNKDQEEQAIALLKKIPAEENRETRFWEKYELPISSAYDSQALLGLKKQACNQKKCLFCGIGKFILDK